MLKGRNNAFKSDVSLIVTEQYKVMRSLSLLFLMMCLCLGVYAQSSWEIRFMPQVAFGGKNDLQRPNDMDGTRLSLSKDLQRENSGVFSPRIEVEYAYKRSHFILTGSWLKDKYKGIIDKEIKYNGATFAEGSDLRSTYSFNTYRLTYRYRFVEREKFDFEFGATLLLRDAYIKVADSEQESRFDNVGVAPLLSYYLGWKPTNRITVLSYGDAFGVKQGRAIDIYAGVKYQFIKNASVSLGYRLLEGGSDVDRIYTMSLFQYLSFGIGVNF